MILDVIILHNFRQYYGTQKIFFSKSKEKNITVIHGGNGAGKTTLLNAFSWCLYDDLKLDNPKEIINDRVVAESKIGEKIEAYVQIQFSDNNRDYTVTRKIIEEKVDKSKTIPIKDELYLEYIDESGKTVKPKNPQNTINQILPKNMKDYFFFDGERIDNLSKKDGAEEIQKAIKNIMGLEVLTRAIRHLKTIHDRFRDEIKRYGDIKIQKLIEQAKGIEKEISDKTELLQQLQSNRISLVKQKEVTENKLRELEGAKELQKKRDVLMKVKEEIEKEIDEKIQEIRNECSNYGYLAFALNAINKTYKILELKREKGEIPSGIKSQFVDDLLRRGICICGCELKPGTPQYLSVSKWKEKSNSKELEDKYMETNASIKLLEKQRSDLFKTLERLKDEKDKLLRKLKSIREELDEISAEFDEKENEEIKDLEAKRRELESNIKNTDQNIGQLRGEIQLLELEKNKIERKVKESLNKEEKANLATRRLCVCSEAREALEKLYAQYACKVRESLQKKIDKVFSNFFTKDYWIEINEEYELNMYKKVNSSTIKTVAMSQGERQISSLSFIGSIVDIAREQYEKEKKNYYFRGGIYPIVMDSPFGTLELDHRENIAEGIPALADQVVVIVSNSQWNGPVERKMKNRVGKEYHLKYYNRKKDSTLEYEYTEIKEGRSNEED